MFLKTMELSGFKSFADKTILNFDEGITGIVGPNGCGKSNVNDAIRWVLGEQSAKSLRSGSSMSDIIFSGSESRRPVNLARVSLTFDNTARIFDSPFDEIEITREIRRSGDTACYINKTPCRLKDISDLVMDTGLGRDSLSIISQGNISSFADARPEERRLLFEEAAGVAKYKKRKKTSLARLEAMNENLERVQDLIDELQRQASQLEEQAAKAKEYTALSEELSSIEISVLAIQIAQYKEKLDGLIHDLKEKNAAVALASAQLDLKEETLSSLRKEVFELDQAINEMQSQYTQVMQDSYKLQRQKDQLDEKRKYALEAADSAQKAASLKEMLDEAQFEYDDRKQRTGEMQLKLSQQEKVIAALRNKLETIRQDIRRIDGQIQSMTSRRLSLENRLQAPVSYNQGVQSVLKNASRLQGVEGTVSSLLLCEPEYEAALQSALGGSADQIVMKDEACSRAAIGWLKKNRSGRATFLPLTVCKSKSLYPDQQQKLASCPGILGVMEDFVSNDPRYDKVRGRLLGNILLADTLEHANESARILKYGLKIVTMDGDTVHAGGAMSGGSRKNNSAGALRKELAEVEDALAALQENKSRQEHNAARAQKEIDEQSEVLLQIRVDYEKLDNVMKAKKDKLDGIRLEYRQLSHLASQAEGSSTDQSDSLVAKLSACHQQMDELTSQMALKRKVRLEKAEEADSLEQEVRQLRRTISADSASIHTMDVDKTRTETRLEESLMRLNSTYSLTYEAAAAQKKDVDLKKSAARIKSLRASISRLGDVNLQAPAMLEETTKKAETLASQKLELENAARQILEAIEEMDQTMTVQFSSMFDKINEQLDGVFKAMFGGGHASLSMTDPEDILGTGIDIDVQPPGKMVKNIQTFSGGEKALIAISVLFAILKARTMPLCIFDEVEAALDQANVERFARYLQHFKDQSQFIVVTHRPGTMEECDTLYGITMQKDGVSKVLKVLLKDAAEYAKEQA